MKYNFLSAMFFADYPQRIYSEFEYKTDRPYAMVCVDLNGHIFALPLRSHIAHNFAYFSDKENRCGIDYTKAVYISKTAYIDETRKPFIRPNEHKALIGKEHLVKNGFINYIKKYVKAQKSKDTNKMKPFNFSTLHYFEPLLDYENDVLNALETSATATV